MLEHDWKARIRQPLFGENRNASVETCRKEWLEILQKYEYGYTPEGKASVSGTILDRSSGCQFAGKAVHERIRIDAETSFGGFSFPISFLRPADAVQSPVMVALAFGSAIPDKYLPAEEILDRGFALAVVDYETIVNDRLSGDYSDGIADAYYHGRPRGKEEWGKIGMWAYGASRIVDYLLTREDIDARHIILTGHSRLGKTALWAGAQDERFYAVCANASCMGGAQLTRGEDDPMYNILGEPIERFLKAGSWDWFCENFKDYQGKESKRPFDQHFLLACIAPRLLCLGCGTKDRMDDYESVYFSAIAASEAYRKYGAEGLIHPDRYPEIGDVFSKGQIEYHLRSGTHFFSRTDWNHYMDFLTEKMKAEEAFSAGVL